MGKCLLFLLVLHWVGVQPAKYSSRLRKSMKHSSYLTLESWILMWSQNNLHRPTVSTTFTFCFSSVLLLYCFHTVVSSLKKNQTHKLKVKTGLYFPVRIGSKFLLVLSSRLLLPVLFFSGGSFSSPSSLFPLSNHWITNYTYSFIFAISFMF